MKSAGGGLLRPGAWGRRPGGPRESRPEAGWTEFGLEAGAGERRTGPRSLMPAQIGVKEAEMPYAGLEPVMPARDAVIRPWQINAGRGIL
jgi:hypothetical protein